MNSNEKICQLRGEINRVLLPLIKSDYVLFGLPYHNNIGDTLIWEGELEFLKQVPYKCKQRCGWDRYPDQPLLDKNLTILIHGGGYMGDVWRRTWEYALDCIKKNSEHKIIIFPNTLHYEDELLAVADADILNRCPDLTLCTRDIRSFELATRYFPGVKSMLVPDMAFCLDTGKLSKIAHERTKSALLIKRIDNELATAAIPKKVLSKNPDIRDWPTIERLTPEEKWFRRLARRVERVGNFWTKVASFYDILYDRIYRPLMIREGVGLISQYDYIYTTRLHAMILSIMLGRRVSYIDNSYGKLSTFYDTWLSDCDIVYHA